jgi:hypothetical protein
MDKKIDRASDIEFAQAIADNLPHEDKDIFLKLGVAYLAGKAVKRVKKR